MYWFNNFPSHAPLLLLFSAPMDVFEIVYLVQSMASLSWKPVLESSKEYINMPLPSFY